MFSIHPKLVFRRPINNYSDLDNLTELELLNRCLNDDNFLTAIFLSSYEFFLELIKCKDIGKVDAKVISTLYNYYSRSATRPTPFGMLSGVFSADFSFKQVLPNSKGSCKISLDRAIVKKIELLLLSQHSILNSVGLTVNNTLITNIEGFSYYKNIGTGFSVESIERSEIISAILEFGSSRFSVNQLFAKLHLEEEDRTDFFEFILELINEEILISDLNIGLGLDSTNVLIEILTKFKQFNTQSDHLLQILESLKQIEGKYFSWRQLIELRNSLATLIDLKDSDSVFHVDLFFDNVFSNGLHQIINFEDIIEAHISFAPDGYNRRLHILKQQLKYTVSNTPIKLIELFNPRLGINYLSSEVFYSNEFYPTADKVKKPVSTVSRNLITDKLLKKVLNNPSSRIINFEQSEIKSSQPVVLPATISCLFSIIQEDNSEKILVKSLSGPSATNLLGRFGLKSSEIYSIIHDIVVHESEVYKDGAELVSLSHANNKIVENIAQRPHLRSRELAFATNWTTKDFEKKVRLENLYVVYDEYLDRIVVVDSSTNQEIIFRWDCAYNHSRNEIPMIQFLSDLQSQEGYSDITFRWPGIFDSFEYFPRLEVGNIILSKAIWKVFLTENEKKSVLTIIEALNKVTPKLPDVFFLVNGDNNILVNLSKPVCYESLVKYCKKQQVLLITEAIEVTNNYFINESGGLLNVEIISTIFNDSRTKNKYNLNEISNTLELKSTGRREWFQFNLFTNGLASNSLIVLVYEKIILRFRNKISKWFFIRYNDPSYHLRFRILFSNDCEKDLIAEILLLINSFIDDLVILRYSIEPYNREVSRYGLNTIHYCESVFHLSSERVLTKLHTIQLKSEVSIEPLFLEAMTFLRFIELCVNSDKIFEKILNSSLTYLSSEFSISKKNILLMDKNYRDIYRDEKFKAIFHDSFAVNNELQIEINNILHDVDYQEDVTGIMISLFHMHCNRLFESNARYNELLAYYFYRKMRNSSKYF